MSLIKKIIGWFIALLRRLFKSNKRETKKLKNGKNINKKNQKNKSIKSLYNEELPPYMMISKEDKLSLINNIDKIKKDILEMTKNDNINRLMTLLNITDNNMLSNYLNNDNSINIKKVEKLANNYLNTSLNKEIIQDIEIHDKIVKNNIELLDDISNYLENNDISIGGIEIINDKILKISDNKELKYDKDILNKINNWDKSIISEVNREYQSINYITISTTIVDRIINKYQKIENDYKNHRFNRYYYEKEISIIKEQINYLRSIKNTSIVQHEIEELRKELFIKSKDKYDILYNNEIYIDLENKCNNLLVKVNQKVIDLKKNEEVKKEKEEKKEIKREYIDNIIKRFKDLNLSCELIMLNQNKNVNTKDLLSFIENSYNEFLVGIKGDFNFERNKVKTELVKLYNDLNRVISIKKKESIIPINHINFQMSDLIEGVVIKKNEVDNLITNHNKLENNMLVDEKIDSIKEQFLNKEERKKLIKKA